MAKEDMWDVIAVVTKMYRCVFDEPVTQAEARKMFLKGHEHLHVVEEEELEINEIVSVE